jgi:hypothetical protein
MGTQKSALTGLGTEENPIMKLLKKIIPGLDQNSYLRLASTGQWPDYLDKAMLMGGNSGTTGIPNPTKSFAYGGVAGLNGPETVQVGEKGPEVISPIKQAPQVPNFMQFMQQMMKNPGGGITSTGQNRSYYNSILPLLSMLLGGKGTQGATGALSPFSLRQQANIPAISPTSRLETSPPGAPVPMGIQKSALTGLGTEENPIMKLLKMLMGGNSGTMGIPNIGGSLTGAGSLDLSKLL